jgi:hypothetical protein
VINSTEDQLAWVAVEIRKQLLKLTLREAAVTLSAFADQSKTFERDTGKQDVLDTYV